PTSSASRRWWHELRRPPRRRRRRLEDAGALNTSTGVSIVAGATVAEFTCIALLSLLFTRDSSGTGARVALFAAFGVAVVHVALGANSSRTDRASSIRGCRTAQPWRPAPIEKDLWPCGRLS